MADVYKIAVALSMTSNAPSFLAALSKQVTGVSGQVKGLEGSFKSLATTIGGVAIAGGAGIIKIWSAATAASKELTHNLAALSALNIPQTTIDRLDHIAKQTALVIRGSTEASNLGLAAQAYSLLGAENSARIMPTLAKFQTVQAGITGKDAPDGDVYTLLKAADLLGKLVNEKTHQVDPDSLTRFLDLMARVETATHGAIKPETILQIAKQGGAAVAGMSDEGLLTQLMVAQGMGGYRAGTAATSLFQQFIGGKMTKSVAEELHKLGLVGGFKSEGEHLIWDKGALDTEFARDMMRDPLSATEYLQKALIANGYSDLNSQTAELFKIFGRQTSVRLFSDLLRNLPQMIAERGRIEGAMGIESQYDAWTQHDLGTAETDLAKAWDNLMQAVAGPNAQFEIAILNGLTDALNNVSAAAYKMNPETLKDIGVGIGILGLSLVGAGAVAIVAALGPAGWIVLGIGALGAALATFQPKLFSELVDDIKGIFSGLAHMNVGDIVQSIAKLWALEFVKLPNMVADAITAAVMGIGQDIWNAFKGWADHTWTDGDSGGYLGKNPLFHKNAYLSLGDSHAAGSTYADLVRISAPLQSQTPPASVIAYVHRHAASESPNLVPPPRSLAELAKPPVAHRALSGVVPPPANDDGMIVSKTTVYLDGKVVNQHVTKHKAPPPKPALLIAA